MFTASIFGVGCGPDISAQGGDITMIAKNEKPTTLPRPPLKIPMPLDKAGYKIDLTFEVPPLPYGQKYLLNLIGLRVLFAPGIGKVADAIEEHPVTVRIFLHRIENGKEVEIPLFSRRMISGFGEYPYRFEVFEIAEGKATAKLSYSQHSGAPRGTPDASALVLNLAGAKTAVIPGVYRFQVETLEDIPELSGVTAFFVYEEPLKRN